MSRARAVALSAAALGGCALLSVLLLTGTEALTRERVAAARAQAERDALAMVLPPGAYDNDPLVDRITVTAPRWLGSDRPLSVWRARRAGAPSALVLEAVARDGYAGPIELRIGVDAAGRIAGVRVVAHQETPGLGDAIDAGRSDWILGFSGRALGLPPAERWTVRRDGGDFDQFTGATITPRAVVRTVRRTLEYVQAHGPDLHAATSGARVSHDDGP